MSSRPITLYACKCKARNGRRISVCDAPELKLCMLFAKLSARLWAVSIESCLSMLLRLPKISSLRSLRQ